MMTLPDFKEKQILFVQAERGKDNFLKFKNDNILYRKDEENIDMISCHKVFAVFVVGDFSITTTLIRNCERYGISLFLLNNNFKVYARINSRLDGNYMLRERQYKFNDELVVAKKLVKNKAYNQLSLLKERKKLKCFEKELKAVYEKIDKTKANKELLGVEGGISKNFFSRYFSEMNWLRRMPRAKYDVNNVLLDIGYTFAFNFVDSLLNLYGFDVYKGFYHKLFFQRQSLSCDLVEPFRCLIDRQLLKSFRLGQINENDFDYIGGKYVLTYGKQRKYLKIFFDCLLKRKVEIFLYVKGFYCFMMRDNKNFPFFKIK